MHTRTQPCVQYDSIRAVGRRVSRLSGITQIMVLLLDGKGNRKKMQYYSIQAVGKRGPRLSGITQIMVLILDGSI